MSTIFIVSLLKKSCTRHRPILRLTHMLLLKVSLGAAVCRLFRALSLAAAAASFGVENVAQLCIVLLLPVLVVPGLYLEH